MGIFKGDVNDILIYIHIDMFLPKIGIYNERDACYAIFLFNVYFHIPSFLKLIISLNNQTIKRNLELAEEEKQDLSNQGITGSEEQRKIDKTINILSSQIIFSEKLKILGTLMITTTSIEEITEAFEELRRVFTNLNLNLENWYSGSQSSHEYGLLLLDQLRDTLLGETYRNPDPIDNKDNLKEFFQEINANKSKDTALTPIFEYPEIKIVECLKCNSKGFRCQFLMGIELAVKSEGSEGSEGDYFDTLDKCLSNTYIPEILPDFKCPKCKEEKTTQITCITPLLSSTKDFRLVRKEMKAEDISKHTLELKNNNDLLLTEFKPPEIFRINLKRYKVEVQREAYVKKNYIME